MAGYVKLFSKILDSTIWTEDSDTKVIWITMLAMADKDGVIECTIPGLAGRAKVSLEKTELALSKFQSPDKYSWSQVDDGRRIKKIDRGWLLINYEIYREMLSADKVREQNRQRQERYRQRKRNVTVTKSNGKSVTNVTNNAESRHASATANITPPTPLSGGLTDRQVRNITTEMQRIAKAMLGADYSVENALRTACVKIGVDFEKARYLLGENL